jgi:putative CocE/NonD family hydrolase
LLNESSRLLYCYSPSPSFCISTQTRKHSIESTIQQGLSVKMRDGVSLVADVYRPVSEEKFPVLLERTPYNRTGSARMANELASHGYIVVLQDTRGRFASGGEFYPFRNESADGSTRRMGCKAGPVKWESRNVWRSYVGATQMLAAMAVPPHLVSIFPYVTASEYYDGWTYQNGALMQWFSSSWTSGLAIDTLRRQADSAQAPKEWVTTLPLQDYPLLKTPPSSSLAPYFRDWLSHERDDAYWHQWRVSDHYSQMTVMGLHGGGWQRSVSKRLDQKLHRLAATGRYRGGARRPATDRRSMGACGDLT